MSSNFVHLRVRTEFSLVDSIVRVKPLIKKVSEMGMPACGVSDFHSFMGLIKYYKAAQGAGIKPICACDLQMENNDDEEGKPALITLIAQNETGYRNITELISQSYQEGQKLGEPYVKFDWIKGKSEGVIALSGGKFGDVGQALIGGNPEDGKKYLQQWLDVFGDRYYLELQRTSRENDENYLHRAVELAQEFSVPVVATNDVRFLQESQFEVHEARVCIGEGRTLDDPRREKKYSDQQ